MSTAVGRQYFRKVEFEEVAHEAARSVDASAAVSRINLDPSGEATLDGQTVALSRARSRKRDKVAVDDFVRARSAIQVFSVRAAGLHIKPFLLDAIEAARDVRADVVVFVGPPAPVEKMRSPINSHVTFQVVSGFAVVSDEGVGNDNARATPPVDGEQIRLFMDREGRGVFFEDGTAVYFVRPGPFIEGSGASNEFVNGRYEGIFRLSLFDFAQL